MKKQAESHYKEYLSDVKQALGGKETDSVQLDRAGTTLFGSRFVGVFPSDKIPRMRNGSYAILNLDASGSPGTHWVGVSKSGGKTLVYDSFGRSSAKIIPSIMNMRGGKGKVIDTEYDAEQKGGEDCGQRVLAWLCTAHVLGQEAARHV